MSSKGRSQREAAWSNAKKICRLNRRQVEMARSLGMNPKKLPGLRPSPKERWKLPVGEFIEECYSKRFGKHPLDDREHKPEPGPSKPSKPGREVDTQKAVKDPLNELAHLISYLAN